MRNGMAKFAVALVFSTMFLGRGVSAAYSQEDNGCNSHHTRNGAVLGGVVGGLLGNLAGGRHSKGLSTFVGAGLGAALGGAIGRQLDEEDCQKFIQATQQTLDSGQDSHWDGQEASGDTHITNNYTETRTQNVSVLEDNVDTVPPLEIVGGRFTAISSGNVRSGPSTSYKVVGQMTKGEKVDVIGKVKGEPWYMIGEGGIGSGYVSTLWVKPTGQAASKASSHVASPAQVKTVSTSTDTSCAAVHQTVTMRSGQTQSQDVKACKNPDGSWTSV